MDRGSDGCGPMVVMERTSSCVVKEDDGKEGSGVRFLWVLVRRDGSAGGGDGGARRLADSAETQQPLLFQYHNGPLLTGKISINLICLLAGTTINPFGNGLFQGPKDTPLEAASACPGLYGKWAYPGYAGDLLVDPATGASYNANRANGRKYLVPALFDPATQT
ncbi:hypothetical protein SO802_032834 [Lithocarpus litseifolius]|uniref:Uncharacterized protein n=1 Tax=Lithocarpus litseifolius TaxID=425828 RepID=A0AAW2BEB5_9ROSI